MSASSYIHLDDCNIKAETEKAFRVECQGGTEWIPKGQIANPADYSAGDESVTLSVTEWIAEQKGRECLTTNTPPVCGPLSTPPGDDLPRLGTLTGRTACWTEGRAVRWVG